MTREQRGVTPGIAVGAVLRRLSVLSGGIDWKRWALDANVLQGAMPVRAGTARHRAMLPEARERERRFRDVSSSYAAAASDGTRVDPHLRRIAVDGLTWWVPLTDPDDEAAVTKYLRHQDFPYRAITQTRELGLGGTMLDIGGNNGRMSIPRVVLGDVQAAYCAEPEPLNYACLVRNVRDNGLEGLVMPDCVAIGAENGSVRMVRAKSPGGHKVIEPGVRPKRETIDVPCLTLDSWCERIGVSFEQVSFVKIDAQGSEVHVLRGATRALTHPHIAWQLEVDVMLLRERGVVVGDLFAILARHFTHWVDLNSRARGARVRPIDQLAAGLAYLESSGGGRTDMLAFTLQGPPGPVGRS
jgi:FkbM family methyltransferase